MGTAETSKKLITEVLTDVIGGAEENLNLALRKFKNYSEEKLNLPYGESDYTPKQILEGYRKRLNQLLEAKAYAEK